MLRLFVAVKLSSGINSKIAALLLGKEPDLAWVREENLHVTLKFLGATEPEKIGQIGGAMRESSALLPVETSARGLGVFPDERRARVLWVGLEDANAGLERMAQMLDQRLGALGFKREARAFSPHLTVARIKATRTPTSVARLLKTHRETFFGSCLIDEVVLFESKTFSEGVRYSPVQVITKENLC